MDLQSVTDALWDAAGRGDYAPAEWRGKLSIVDGYQVQRAFLERHVAEGQRQAGWKVGLTAKAIQEQFGFHEPLFGFLLERGSLSSGVELEAAALIDPRCENELCLTVGTALQGPGVTRAQARAAIVSVAPALELVEIRFQPPIDWPLALVDNLSQKAFITGPPTTDLPPDFALAETTCEVAVNGEVVARATGEAVLGDPAESLAWLANKLAESGRRVEPGQRIMAGSFTQAIALKAGDRIETRFEPFGTAVLSLR